MACIPSMKKKKKDKEEINDEEINDNITEIVITNGNLTCDIADIIDLIKPPVSPVSPVSPAPLASAACFQKNFVSSYMFGICWFRAFIGQFIYCKNVRSVFKDFEYADHADFFTFF